MKKKSLLLILLMALIAPWAVAQQSLPYSYGFEDNDLSTDGWTTTCTSNDSGIQTNSAHSGTYGFTFYYSERNGYLVSPQLNGATYGLDLSFYYREYSSLYGDEQFQVGYTTDASNTDPSTFTYGDVVTASTSWQTYTNSFPAGTVRIAVKYIFNDAFYLFLDDFTFEPGASCKTPTDLTATNLTTESATLGWTAPDPAPSNGYNVRYRTSVIEHPYYLDDFETNSLTGWTIYTDGDAPQSDGWYTINPESGLEFSAHSGSYCASAWSWSNQAYDANNWLISPQVPLTGTLRFYVRTNQSYPDEYEVLLSSTGTDEADFDVTLQAMAAAPATGEWAEVSISLKSYSGNGYIAIHHVSNDCNYLLIDDFGIFDEPTPAGAWTNTTSKTNSKDIAGLTESTLYDFEVQSNCGGETSDWVASTFRTLPSCMPVANLAVGEVTTTTVSLTWTDQNSGSASYIITDGNDNSVTVTNLTTTGCTVIELKANTAYTFKVTADCGSTTETIQARTECDALSTIPYNEGFEASSEIFYCWDLDEFGRLNNSAYAHTGNVSLFSQDASVAYAILPTTTANTSALMLNFWYYNYYGGYDLGSLEVGYLTDIDDYTTFVNVGTIDMSVSYDEYIHTDDFVFDGAPDGSRIALRYNEGTDAALVIIDDVTLEYKPACMRPTNLVALNPTGHGATFAWDGNGSAAEDGWQLYISKNGSAISTGYESPSGVIDADTNPFTVTSGLDPETDYYVWVRSHCDTQGYSPWSNSATFTTTEACPAPTGLTASEITGTTAKLSWTGTSESYVLSVGVFNGTTEEEGFEHSGSVPTDWTHIGSGNISINSTASRVHTGSYSLRFAGATSNNVVVLPDYGFEANTATISFWSLAENSSYSGTFQVGYVTDATDASTFQTVGNYAASAHTSYTHVENVSLASAPAGARIAFRHTSASSSYWWWIDDVEIVFGSVTSWNEYSNITNQYYTVGSLTPETEYRAKVKGYCGSDGYSVETAPISFTTSAACPEQDGLEASNIQIHSAIISWDAHGATEWNLRYSADNGTTWTTITKAITNPYTLEELDAATDYLVQVQAKCAASDEWSASLAFTTKCDFVTTFPWSEDFESYAAGNFSATCWVNEHIAGSATTNLFKVYTSTTGTNTTHQLQLPDEAIGNMIKLVLPGMTLPNSNYAFYIDVYRSDNMYNSSYAEEGIRVFASTDGNIEGATELAFIPRQYNVSNTEIPEETEVGWYTYMLPINMSGNCYIILRGESRYCTSTYMDNFMVSACAPVGTLSYDNLASQTVDLHWTLLDNTQDAWQVCINGDETNPVEITATDVTINGNVVTYSMSGLTAETAYTVKVRANCGGGDFGKWSNTISFSTLAACATPTGLAASNLTMVGADLEWTGSSDVDYYTVQYRTAAYVTGIEQDFSTNPTEEGWLFRTGVLNTDGTATLSGTSSWNRGASNSVLDGQHMYMNMYSTKNWWLITPSMTIADGYVMNMDIAYTPYSNSNPLATGCTTHRFAILISTDDMATWTILREWNNSGSPYVLDNVSQTGENTGNIDLSAYAGETAYIAFFGHSEVSNYDNNFHFDNVSIGSTNAAGAWQTAANDVTTWNYTLEGLTANVKYDARVYANCTTDPDTENDMTTFTTLEEHNIVFPETGNWAATGFEPDGAPTLEDDVIIRANVTIQNGTNAQANNINLENGAVITVASGATLTINGDVTNGGATKLIVEDGGQLIVKKTGINATVKKSVTHAKGVDGWYTIASPINSNYTTATSITNMIQVPADNYDLYYYHESTRKWKNYYVSSFYITKGTGYLYWNSTGAELAFPGSMTYGDVNVSLTKTAAEPADDLEGFNLIGNPYPHNIYKGAGTAIENSVAEGYELATGFYTLSNNGTWQAGTDNSTAIKPAQGILVKATTAGTLTIKDKTESAAKANNDNIKFSVANNQFEDVTYALFMDEIGLTKINHRNDQAPMIYIPQDGERYAIATMGDETDMFNLNFKAMTTGKYTLSYKAEGSYDYLHVIDRITGEDVDMLIDGEYSFMASAGDNENRFIVKLRYNANGNFENDIFAYQNGDEIIVNGEGELQIFDVMGRFVTSMEVNGSERISAEQYSNAVYIFRLVGNDVKTQKIVVR